MAANAAQKPSKKTKSRTGCFTCKQKRRKCDETKPDCLTCLSKKQECGGYPGRVVQWSTKYEVYQGRAVEIKDVSKLIVAAKKACILPELKAVAHNENIDKFAARDNREYNVDDMTSMKFARISNRPSIISPILHPSSMVGAMNESDQLSNADVDGQDVMEDMSSFLGYASPMLSSLEPQIFGQSQSTRDTIPGSFSSLEVGDDDDLGSYFDYIRSTVSPRPNTVDEESISEYLSTPTEGESSFSNESKLERYEYSYARDQSDWSKFDIFNDSTRGRYQADNEYLGFARNSLVNAPISEANSQIKMNVTIKMPQTGNMLINHWFNQVCPIFSSFDSPSNPFRSYVHELSTKSTAVCSAIQSMSGACLSEELPQVQPLALLARNSAVDSVQSAVKRFVLSSDLAFPSEILLILLLLGLSAPWHNPRDFGLMHLRSAQLVMKITETKHTYLINAREAELCFFRDALVYWEMLVGVVSAPEESPIDGGAEILSRSGPRLMNAETSPKLMPHPWTGVAVKVHKLLGRVIQLCRKRRVMASKHVLDEMLYFTKDTLYKLTARDFEEALLEYEHPSSDRIMETKDIRTTTTQLLDLAEAYRIAALLLLYTVFPELVHTRLDSLTESGSLDKIVDDWLLSLALHLCNILKKIPYNSGTRCTQPLLMVIAASSLCYSKTPDHPSSLSSEISSMTHEIVCARKYIIEKLLSFQRDLPSKPIVIATKLVEEIWASRDIGGTQCWIDIMMESKLETLFG